MRTRDRRRLAIVDRSEDPLDLVMRASQVGEDLTAGSIADLTVDSTEGSDAGLAEDSDSTEDSDSVVDSDAAVLVLDGDGVGAGDGTRGGGAAGDRRGGDGAAPRTGE